MAEAAAESSLKEQDASADIAEMLQQPLFSIQPAASKNLNNILNSLNARLEQLAQLQSRDVEEVKQLVDDLDERLQSHADAIEENEPPEPVIQVLILRSKACFLSATSKLVVIWPRKATHELKTHAGSSTRRRVAGVCGASVFVWRCPKSSRVTNDYSSYHRCMRRHTAV